MTSHTIQQVLSDASDDEFEIIDATYSTNQPSIDEEIEAIQEQELNSVHDDNLEDVAVEEETSEEVPPDSDEVKAPLANCNEESEIDRLTRVNEEQRREIEALMSLAVMSTMKVELTEKRAEERMEEIRRVHQTEISEKNEEIERLIRENEQEKKERKIEGYKNAFLGIRTLSFRKIDGRFGAGHIGTSISTVNKGGPADLAGLVEGDQLISINGVNVETKSDAQITKISEDVDDDVTLVVRFNPERLIDLWPNSVHSDGNVIEKCEALRNRIVVPGII